MSHEKSAKFSEKMKIELKNGYIECAHLNVALAEQSVFTDNEALSVCEEKLMESE